MAVQLLKCKACGQTYYQGQKHTCPVQCVRCGQWFYTSVGHNCRNPALPPAQGAPVTLEDISMQLEALIGWVRPMSIILRVVFWMWVAGLVLALMLMSGFLQSAAYLPHMP